MAITAEMKKERRGRNVYNVDGQYTPATEAQKWTPFQLKTLDEVSARKDFDYWVTLSMTLRELWHGWKFGVRGVSYFAKDGSLHYLSIGQRRVLREVVA